MKPLRYTYNNIYRLIVAVMIAFIAPALPALADTWDGISSEAPALIDPALKNSKDNPYIIDTPAKLAFLRTVEWGNTSTSYTLRQYRNAYYRQTVDIDMGGHDFMITTAGIRHCIGYATSAVNNGFNGKYDGDGHVIENVVIDWSNIEVNERMIGLFSVINGGQLTNLTLENVHVTCLGPSVSHAIGTNQTMMLGLITGALMDNSVIENVNLRRCRIDDGNIIPTTQTNNGIYVGAIGNTRKTVGSGADANYTIRNVAIDLVIDLPQTQYGVTTTDFTSGTAGLLVGRLNKVESNSKFHISNIMARGEINAPYLVNTAPIWGNVSSGTSYTSLSEINRQYGGTFSSGASRPQIPADIATTNKLYFSDFGIWLYGSGTPTEATAVNATVPSNVNTQYSTRTFADNTSGFTPSQALMKIPANLDRWRGVNRGEYMADPADMVDVFNTGNDTGVRWYWDETTRSYMLGRLLPDISVKQVDHDRFDAYLSRGEAGKNYTLRWYGSTDGVNFDAVPFQTDNVTIINPDWLSGASASLPDTPAYTHIRVELESEDGYINHGYAIPVEAQHILTLTLKRLGFNSFAAYYTLNFGTLPSTMEFIWWGQRIDNNQPVVFTELTEGAVQIPSMSLYGSISVRLGDQMASIDVTTHPELHLDQLSNLEVQAEVTGAYSGADYRYRWEVSPSTNEDVWDEVAFQGQGIKDVLNMDFNFVTMKRVRCSLFTPEGDALATVIAPVELDLEQKTDHNFAGGMGTPRDPYLVANFNQLKYIQTNQTNWSLHFRQTADIVVPDDEDLGMIGYGVVNSDHSSIDRSRPFTGSYDGDGYKISGHNIFWQGPSLEINYDNVAYGLFGYIRGGSVRNLHLDGFTITRQSAGVTTFDSRNVRIGILAGVVGSGSRIENIIITNSTISDGGLVSRPYLMAVGGAIGEIAHDFAHPVANGFTDNIADRVYVRNVYADVDITLTAVSHEKATGANVYDLNCGGIVGRVRAGRYFDLPSYTLFTGTIEAPRFTVGPCWGASRVDRESIAHAATMTDIYAGQIVRLDGSMAVLDSPTFQPLGGSQVQHVDANRLFWNYRVRNRNCSQVSQYVDSEVTDVIPDGSLNVYGTRTFARNYSSGNAGITQNAAETWRAYQGFNHGTYTDVSDPTSEASQAMLSMFNRYANTGSTATSPLLPWTYDAANQPRFGGESGFLRLVRTGFATFTVKAYDGNSQEIPLAGSSFVWRGTKPDGTVVTLTTDNPTSPTYEFHVQSSDPSDHTEHPDEYLDLTVVVDGTYEMTLDIATPIFTISRTSASYLRVNIDSGYDDACYSVRWYGIDADDNQTLIATTPGSTSATVAVNGLNLYKRVLAALYCASDIHPICDHTNTPITVYAENLDDVHSFFQLELNITNEPHTRYSVRVREADKEGTVYLTDATGKVIDPDALAINPDPDQIEWIWEQSMDPSADDSWQPAEALPGTTDTPNAISPAYPRGLYYRLTMVYNGARVAVVQGPVLQVYVYDKAMTANAIAAGLVEFDNDLYPDGSDTNTGGDPYNAVKTMKAAYDLLRGNAGRDPNDPEYEVVRPENNNIIIMGYVEDRDFLRCSMVDTFSKPARITGNSGAITNGTLTLVQYSGDDPLLLGAATEFSDITLSGSYWYEAGVTFVPEKAYFHCNQHDFTIGEKVKIRGYAAHDTGYALLTDNAPFFDVIAGVFNFNQEQLDDRPWNEVPNVATLNVYSGNFGRIICSNRNDPPSSSSIKDGGQDYSQVLTTSYNIVAKPEKPYRAIVNIAINHPTGNNNEFTPGKKYDYDVNLITGGQTDGSVYGDVEVNLVAGRVGRFAAGNLTYGRDTGPSHPCDSYWGSSVFNMTGGSVHEIYGSSLGRSKGARKEYYYYGRSTLNIYGGTIQGDLYGAGAISASGLGDDYGHTSDPCIPYIDDWGNLAYGPYAQARGRMPKMQLHDGTLLDLATFESDVNIFGGVIEGNVYGGGYGYSKDVTYDRSMVDAGNVYGNTHVLIDAIGVPPIIKGNVYGGGGGTRLYYKAAKTAGADPDVLAEMLSLGCTYGNTDVVIRAGEIRGNVYAGSKGVPEFPESEGMGNTPDDPFFTGMAAVYGNANVHVADNAVIFGDIFGGCEYGWVRRRADHSDENPSGNTRVDIAGGQIGNNIFGGGRGNDRIENFLNANGTTEINGAAPTNSVVEGNAEVEIMGGRYITQLSDNFTGLLPLESRNYNIYGGGYLNADVWGNTSLTINQSLLWDEASLGTDFMTLWGDLRVRRVCVYGAGYGAETLVHGSTNVNLNINGRGFLPPNGEALTRFVPGQVFIDVSGGGYSGNVGYWTNAAGEPSRTLEDSEANLAPQEYHHFTGGDVSVTAQGYPYVRKLIGGGFYGNVVRTHTTVRSGTYSEIYGGCLLGYVWHQARTNIGTQLELPDNASVAELQAATVAAQRLNKQLHIINNVYGGNDVNGIVGVELWTADKQRDTDADIYAMDVDGAPMYCSSVTNDEDDDVCPGVQLNLFGGTVHGNVYGAGNGHYRGYYVPGWHIYSEGSDRHYNIVKSFDGTGYGKVYRTRPMTGIVKLNISGNNTFDRMVVQGNVFGGGRSCTVGQWNTRLSQGNPRRLRKGGFVHVNFGSHVSVEGSAYMGSEGAMFYDENDRYGQQTVLPAGFYSNIQKWVNPSPATLDELGIAAYRHWYWNSETNRYEMGYPAPGKIYDSNIKDNTYKQMPGEHQFRGYLKNIEMPGDLEITFYDKPYDANGRRRHWLPGEMALTAYDATDISFDSFYLGGRSGSMTNNQVMKYTYQDAISDEEDFGTIYRLTLPRSVTLREKLVCGSENAYLDYFGYNSDLTAVRATEDDGVTPAEPWYSFYGGMVTQSPIYYDLIWYNANYSPDAPLGQLPEDFDTSLVTESCTTYLEDGTEITVTPFQTVSLERDPHRLACYVDDQGRTLGYLGRREHRDETTVKLTAANQFELKEHTTPAPTPGRGHAPVHSTPGAPIDHLGHYGALIYGGCYNSGYTMGDVVLNVGCNLLGSHLLEGEEDIFGEISSLKFNVGRVFGGGFGEKTQVDGDTYVNLLHDFKGMNVFGGGNMGSVTGTANVTYIGSETESYVYGAIYGGGLRGDVGTLGALDEKGNLKKATNVQLYSGNVDKVYGGSCMGNLYGQASVYMADQVTTELDHLDYERLVQNNNGIEGWGGSRLIAGSVYGGNDVGGFIHVADPALNETEVHLHEEREATSGTSSRRHAPEQAPVGPGKTSPGSSNGYNGFPLIGSLYGGSNGAYGDKVEGTQLYYTSGEVVLATGNATESMTVYLGGNTELNQEPILVPNLSSSRIRITGGTVVSAYGGGNRATITDRAQIEVVYPEGDNDARAGFESREELDRIMSTCHLVSFEQLAEVMSKVTDDEGKDAYICTNQVHRIFGGNNYADMGIQPEWTLTRGFVGTIYSGANFGRMTYYDPEAEHPGLSITIDSDDLHAGWVYGGCRVGHVTPSFPAPLDGQTEYDPGEDFYGATVYIKRGIVDHVYGGNDVSGDVMFGSHVDISGAISGDVYGAGNGNYLYKYDTTGNVAEIEEKYDDQTGARYFVLPKLDMYGTGTQDQGRRVLAINRYRPNADRVKINIHGSETSPVYVRGNIYCGGNSSTVSNKTLSGNVYNDIKFNIGSYVTLNGVFLGCNGESLADGYTIEETERLNGLDVAQLTTLTNTDNLPDSEKDLVDNDLYPSVLDLYMRAVEVSSLPDNFTLPSDATETYIGTFCVGGNHGSMMVPETITLEFPRALTVYERIIGGSKDANVTYNGRTHVGGLTHPLRSGYTDKVQLFVKSRFAPMRLDYPIDDNPPILLSDNLIDIDGKKYYPNGQCNIYGGCYNSGSTVGNISIFLYSDMLDYANTIWHEDTKTLTEGPLVGSEYVPLVRKQAIVDGLDDFHWMSFGVVGGGMGANTRVEGDIAVRLMPAKSSDTYLTDGWLHPSASSVFGGSREGRVVGNTRVEVRDGVVLTNVYGASEGAQMFGSSTVIIGYPEYYRAKVRGEYILKRADNVSRTAVERRLNDDDHSPVILDVVRYLPDDIVPLNVYEMIDFTGLNPDDCFEPFGIQPARLSMDPDNDPVKWDDLSIRIGDHYSKHHPEAPFYGHGNVYGGGFVKPNPALAIAGKDTVLKFRTDENRGVETIGYGGNSAVLVWDNKENRDPSRAIGEADASDGSLIQDHVSVGTGYYKQKAIKAGDNLKGLYYYDRTAERFVHQPPGVLSTDNATDYYELLADGGVYGGGREVLVEGFRSVDLGYYGYADYTPQFPKLLNTIQRADVVSVRDCCLQLQGASDFAASTDRPYSINRVGELQMLSSIPVDDPLVAGERDSNFMNNVTHDVPRSRNYLAFFNDVHYLAAFVSNVGFNTGNHTDTGAKDASGKSYLTTKHDVIKEYYDSADDEMTTEEQAERELKFKKRNLGTSANMIGINNGYSLRIQGAIQESVPEQIDKFSENFYYGPAFGVTEVKPLTLALGEGGGYIYALNHHYDPAYDNENLPGVAAEYPAGTLASQDFLHTTANFVFPGAAFLLTEDSEDYNYIVDDCYPLYRGYDWYKNAWAESSTPAGPTPARHRAPGVFDVNDYYSGDDAPGEEIHYWYVNGTRFYYDVTLTGYTNDSADQPKSFFLNNHDNLISLPGIEPGTEVVVKSVTWEKHDDSYDCDLANTELNYRLLLTIDANTEHRDLEPDGPYQGGAFVAELPRTDYRIANGTDPGVATAGQPDPNSANNGRYGVTGIGGDGKPLLVHNEPAVGIRLIDAVDNRFADDPAEVGHEYWEDHLAVPHHVEIVLATVQQDEYGEEHTFEYTINLTINYLLGPALKGHIVIENCALPGEYIFANANDVTVDMDHTIMAVTEQNWYLFPLKADGTVADEGIKINSCKLPNTDVEVEIPAYYYQNGWKVRYGVVANGEPIYANVDPAPETEHTEIEVHNYHRMLAWDRLSYDGDGNPKVYDLKLVRGARVYIEDDDDMTYFFRYLSEHQTEAAEEEAPDGRKINPRYAEGIDFYVQYNVNVPTRDELELHDMMVFRGNFNGNGRRLNIHDNTYVPICNEGHTYNTGFYSESTEPLTIVYNDNSNGTIENSYYYNTKGVGSLAPNGTLINCYQNTPLPSDDGQPYAATAKHFGYTELLSISTHAFHYGQVAYNLNGHYLDKRASLLSLPGVENRPLSLYQADRDNRGNAAVAEAYIERMFNNGDYRYALWQQRAQFAMALRTAEHPNYANKMGNRASHHVATHDNDQLRWDEDARTNWPRYDLDDYLFFGQDLTQNAAPNEMPDLFTPETRVYRAGGFYGDRVDKGFFFNNHVYASSPILTAIDLTGYRDNDPTLNNKNGRRGWFVEPTAQEIYYPPTLDMPWDTEGHVDVQSVDFGPEVTRNVLIYSPADDYFSQQFHYYTQMSTATDYDYARHDQTTVYGHHIESDGDNSHLPHAAGGFLHLVDSYEDSNGDPVPNDFNAPIAFAVDRAAWLQRTPTTYSNGGDGWDGIVLPFTAHHVYAVAESNETTHEMDHGEVTHFYGPYEPDDEEAEAHEYWLRRFGALRTDPSDGTLKAVFYRPGSDEDIASNPSLADEVRNYIFSNRYFVDAFYDYTSWGHDLPQYNGEGDAHFNNYPMLTQRIPYIVSFPGTRYYEFDFSGEFYAELNPPAPVVGQRVSYISDPAGVVIPVTDLNPPVAITHTASGRSYTMDGTFRALTVTDNSMATIDPGYYQGSEFEAVNRVAPFHAYMYKTDRSPMMHNLAIVGRGGDDLPPEEPESPADELAPNDFRVWVDGSDLMIDAPYEGDIVVYNMLGQGVRRVHTVPGRNRFGGLPTGFYVALTTKVRIP